MEEHLTSFTEEKKAEIYKNFFAWSPDFLAVIDFQGNILLSNPSPKHAYGKDGAEDGEHSVFEFISDEDKVETMKNLHAYSEGESIAYKEIKTILPNGETKWLQFAAIPDSVSKLVYTFSRDITEAKNREALLQAEIKELKKKLNEYIN